MAVLPIVIYPDPVLAERCSEVTSFDDELRRLADDMIETMHDAPGVGLAANQVGDRRRILVADPSGGEDPDAVRVLVNPRIVHSAGTVSGEEGCLSVPGIFEFIDRPREIRYRAADLDGRIYEDSAADYLARILCHEIDHLDGILFLDRMSPIKRRFALRKIERMRRTGEWPGSAA